MHNSMEGTRDDYRSPADIREQRRYEIAKACMAAQERLIVYSVKDAAARSVAAADALLAELDKKP